MMHKFLVSGHTVVKDEKWYDKTDEILNIYDKYVEKISDTEITIDGKSVYSSLHENTFTRWFAVYAYLYSNPNSSEKDIIEHIDEYYVKNGVNYHEETYKLTLRNICKLNIIQSSDGNIYNINDDIASWKHNF